MYLGPVEGVPLRWTGVIIAGFGDGRPRLETGRIVLNLLFHGADLPLTQHLPRPYASTTTPAALGPLANPPAETQRERERETEIIFMHSIKTYRRV